MPDLSRGDRASLALISVLAALTLLFVLAGIFQIGPLLKVLHWLALVL
jgi:hypothetical protein